MARRPGHLYGRAMSSALVTGASRGLGLALARPLAARGWALVIDGRGPEALEAARRELAEHTEVVAIAGDVADARHRRELVSATSSFDLLVNNASTLGVSPLLSLASHPLD